MLYFDSAALVKLIRREQESDTLVTWLNQHQGTPLVASALAEVEVPRALRRSEPQLLGSVSPLLSRLYLYELTSSPHLKAGDSGTT